MLQDATADAITALLTSWDAMFAAITDPYDGRTTITGFGGFGGLGAGANPGLGG